MPGAKISCVQTKKIVALSTADTNKWETLLNGGDFDSESQVTGFNNQRTGPIRQPQRRLSGAQALLLADKYRNGATVYQLAEEFRICRSSVSVWLKRLEIPMRRQSPDDKSIDSMISLYLSGFSLASVAQQLGTSPGTVHNHLKSRRIQMRDSHGRQVN